MTDRSLITDESLMTDESFAAGEPPEEGESPRTGSHIKKWLRLALNVVLYLTIALACVLVLISVLSQRDQPLWGLHTYVVTSGSMEPEIKTGSLIIAQNTQASAVEVGEVITYDLGDEIIAHRVIEIRTDGLLVTKGDANEITDYPVLPQDVSGKVVLTIPYLGTLTNFVHSFMGFVVLIIVPALLLLGMFLWDIWIGNAKKKNNATMAVAPLLVVGLILCGLHTSVAQAYYSAESRTVGVSMRAAEQKPLAPPSEQQMSVEVVSLVVNEEELTVESTTTTTLTAATTTTTEVSTAATTTTSAPTGETTGSAEAEEPIATTTTTTAVAAPQ